MLPGLVNGKAVGAHRAVSEVGQPLLREQAEHVDAVVRDPVAREQEPNGERVGT